MLLVTEYVNTALRTRVISSISLPSLRMFYAYLPFKNDCVGHLMGFFLFITNLPKNTF